MANNLGQRDHGLNIPIQLGNISDTEKRALLSNINQIAKQMQGTLSDAISQEQIASELRGALGKFNDMLKKFKVEPIELNVADIDNLSKMSRPFEELGRMAMDKFAKNFKMGDISGIISSDITDAINIVGGAIDKIYDKMEQGAKKSSGNMIRSMEEVAKVASKITKKTDKQDIQRALSGRMEATTDKTGKSDPKRNYQALYSTSKNMVETDDNFVEKYKADLKFARNFEKLSEAQREAFYGKERADVEAHYNKLQETIHQKMMVLNNILAEVGFTDKKGNAYVHQGGEPWAREKTLQEVKNILKGGLTVKDGGKSSPNPDGKNLNSSNPAKDSIPEPNPNPEPKAKTPKAKTPEVDTSAFNQKLFDAIEKLSDDLAMAFKQMIEGVMDTDQLDDKNAELREAFLKQFKFNNNQKIDDYLAEKSDDMGGWDSKKIYNALSKKLSPEDPSWLRDSNDDTKRSKLTQELDELTITDDYYSKDDLKSIQSSRQQILQSLEQEGLMTEEIRVKQADITKEIERRMDVIDAQRNAEDTLNKLDNMGGEDIEDPDELRALISKRREMIDSITSTALEDGDPYNFTEDIEKEKQYNLQLEKRALLLDDVKQGLIDITSVDDIIAERGNLESKLERLGDVAYVWGSTIKDGEEDDAITELQEFEETYDRIILKLANGRKVEILPNAKGLRALHKYDDGLDKSAYGETEIDDVVFERRVNAHKEIVAAVKAENEESRDNLSLQNQINTIITGSLEAINNIVRELSQLPHEKIGMLNSQTGAVSDEFIDGTSNRAKGSFNNKDGYDTMFHNHPDVNTASPGAADWDAFVQEFDYFKKQLVIAKNEVASFDFSKLTIDQLKEIAEAIKHQLDVAKYDTNYAKDSVKYGDDEAHQKWSQKITKDVMAKYPGVMSIHNIDDFTPSSNIPADDINSQTLNKLSEVLGRLATALNKEKPDATATINTEELGSVLHDGRPYLVDINGKSEDAEVNKVAIDTEGLQSVLTAITFKVQDISEKEQVNSAIDQESINTLVGAIKTAITPQSDGESKSTAPWAKEETLRNITGSTLGKIANSIPKVDTKGLAKNDTLNQVAQATKAINNKISGKITGNVKDIKANQEKVATDKRNNEVKALLDQFRQLGQKDAQKSLATGDERAALEKEIKGLQMRLGKQRKALGVDESMTKVARIEGKDVAINTHNEEVAQKEANITKELTKVYDEYISLMDKRENIALKMVGLDPVKNQKELDALRKYYDVVDNIIHTEYGDVLGNPEVQKRFTVGDFAEPYEEWQRKGAVKTGKAEDAAKQKEINALYREYIGLMNERESKNAKLAGLDVKRDAAQIAALESSISQIEDRMQETFGNILGDKVATSIFSADDFQKHYEKWQRKIQEAEGKKRDKDAKKTLDEEIKAARKQNNLDIADSTYNSARKTMASLWQLDSSIDPASIPQVQALQSEMQELDTIYKQVNDKIRAGQALSDEEIKDLQLTSNMTAQKTEKLKELIQNYTKLQNGEEIGRYVGGAGSEQEQLQKAINDRFGGKAKIKEYKQNADGTVTAVASVKTGTRAFTEYTVAVSQADKKIKMLTGTTKQLPSFLDSVKRKLGEISQYVSAMSVISRAGQELRKGIQYVRDIDLALTELKKVTDETEESYEKFLDTASKTAAKVGSTIKDVISSTADFARIGYTFKEAALMAESAQVLMNVSEFTDVNTATDTLISAVKAFDYTAEETMNVVDTLNIIGNNYAISTADLATSLTKSSASLVAAGGDLAEAAALTATANAIVQDADSVGTALKTTSLRLRGTSVTELEEEGVDSEGAVTSKSKLQGKVKALSGVDILTESGDYKSTYQILSQIADVWEDINNMDQAALLELLAGKRNASVLAAILQAPEELKAAYEDAQNAEGSALKENEKYMDSIQGRIDQFNNALQTMWANLLDDDVVKFFVDLGKQLVVLLDKIGPLNALFIGFGIFAAKKYNLFDNLFGKPDSIEKSIEQLQQQRAKLDGLTGTKAANERDAIDLRIREKQAILDQKTATEQKTAATWKELAVQIVSGKVTKDNIKENIKNVLVTKLTNSALGEKVAAHYGVQVAELGTLTITQLLTGGFTALAGAIWTALAPLLPFIAAAAAIAGVVALAVYAIDQWWVTAGEAKEKLEELNSEIDSLKTELDSLNSELETTQERMEELLSKDSLSFTEQEELNNLKLQNEHLERQIELQKLILDNKKKARLSAAQDVIDKTWDSKSYGKEDYQVDWDDGVIKKDGFWSFGRSGKDAIEEGLKRYTQTKNNADIYYDSYTTALEKYGSEHWITKQNKDQYEKFQKQLTNQESGINMVLGEMSNIITENELQYGQSDEIDKFLDEYHAMTLKWQEAQGLSGKSDIIKSIFSDAAPEGIQQLKKQLDEVAGSNLDSAIKQAQAQELIQNALDSTDKDYQRLNTTMSTLGMTADELAESFIAVSNAPDISTIGGVLEVFADGEEILRKSSKYREQVKNEMEEIQKTGSVNLLNRKQIKTSDMMKSFYSQDKYAEQLAKELESVTDQDLSTLWTSTYSNKDFGLSGQEVAMNFTPILPDGTVMEKDEFESYVAGVLGGAEDTLQLKIGATFEGENAIEEAGQAADHIHELQEAFYEEMQLGVDEAGEAITWDNLFKEVDGEKVADNLKIASILEGADKDVRDKFTKIVEEVENGKKSVDQALAEWQMAGIDKTVDVLNAEFETLNTEMFPEAADEISGMIDTVNELSAALESVAGAMDLVHTAQTQMSKSGRISVKTALEIMQSTEDWDKVLNITEDSITLLDGAEQVLIQTQLESIKKQTEAAATMADKKYQAALLAAGITELEHEEQILTGTQKQVNQITNEGIQQMAGYEASTDNAVDAEYDHVNSKVEVMTADAAKSKAIGILAAHLNLIADIVAAIGSERTLGDAWSNYKQTLGDVYATADASMTNLDTLRRARDNRRDINKAMSNVDDVNEFKNNYDYDETPGDKYDDSGDGETAFEKMQARHEREIAALEHQQELIQGDIDILEAQRKGISSDYYKKLIDGENSKIDAYERQLKEAKELLANTSTTSEEYNDIVKYIWDIEKGLQDTTLAAIEFGEAMNANYLKGITDMGDAYENLYTINDRQKGSMELYKEGVEIGGGYVNERWYDDMIAKAGEAGELARQELTDSLWAIDQYRNQKNPFEVGTAEYEGFEFDRNKNLQEAWAQAADAKDKIQEEDNKALQLAEDKKDAYIEAWENVVTGFERIGALFENQISLIDGYESRLEALNINVSDAVYEKKIGTQKDLRDNLEKAIAYDEQMLAEYAAKYGTNDERYISKWEELNDKRVQRYEAETQIIELEQQIIDNQIDRFNQTIDRMSSAVDKMKNIAGLIPDKDVVDEEDGNWTAEGLTRAGMSFQERAYQKEMVAAYADEMEELTRLYDEGKISEKEYYEQMKELEDGQWSAINAYKAAEDAIIDLQEARIDMIEKGLEEEIDAYSELIEMKKEELDAERDLFEFRRDVEDQSKDIAEIERRMASISNSSADEDRAEYKRLEKELYEANRGLNDTYRNHSYDQTSQALDEELETFEKTYEDYIKDLRDELKNTDELIKQIYSDVVTNGQLVLETLVQLSDEHGFTLDANLTAPWRNANGTSLEFEEAASRHYTNVKNTVEYGTAGFVDNITKPWKRGQEESALFGTKAKFVVDQALLDAQNKQSAMSDTLKQPWLDAKGLIDQGPTWVSTAAAEILKHVKQNVIDINAEYAKITPPSAYLSDNVVAGGGGDSGSGGGGYTGGGGYVPTEKPKTTKKPHLANYTNSEVLALGFGPLSASGVKAKIDSGAITASQAAISAINTAIAIEPYLKKITKFSGASASGMKANSSGDNGVVTWNGQQYEVQNASTSAMSSNLGKAVKHLGYSSGQVFGYSGSIYAYLDNAIQKLEGRFWSKKGYNKLVSDAKSKYSYAKGTLGTTSDQWAITDEPQYGDELVLVPNAAGNLSFMRKGTGVVPADLTKRIMEIAQMPTSELGSNIVKAFVPNIETNTQSVQVNFEALVKADNITNDVLPEVEKLVAKQLNTFTKNLNYSLKKVGGR